MFVDLFVAILGTATVNTIVVYVLQRRLVQSQAENQRADALARYQAIVNDLWQRIHELEERAHRLSGQLRMLEHEVEQLRQLVAAYERTYGRQFVICEGRIVRVDEGGTR